MNVDRIAVTQRYTPADVKSPPGKPPPLQVFSATDLMGEAPERAWIVQDWLPCGVVTGLYGDGGLGKTLLAQQLQSAAAAGALWLGLVVEQVCSLGLYCEDSREELWRRQNNINAHLNLGAEDLKNSHFVSRLGEDNLLMTFTRSGTGQFTAFYKQVVEAALDLKARLVVIDTAADAFGGNENDRGQVRQFVSRALGSIALQIAGAVLLCAHPSRTGLASGEGDGASTAWSNTLRSRLFLRGQDRATGEKADPDARLLQRRKANYAARNDEIALRWRGGVIDQDGPPPVSAFAADVCDVFLDLLTERDRQNRPVSASDRAGNYAPKVFAATVKERRFGFARADFQRAMEQLFTEGRIENVDCGRKGDPRRKIVHAAPR